MLLWKACSLGPPLKFGSLPFSYSPPGYNPQIRGETLGSRPSPILRLTF